eukprot:CAMPEP_0119472238 /NCGR_PEP_ID=MMETSP1344-20130328/4383_1 /TAXON_ID=236787 /ORGANISM="Florenciella parvula, Strain CCMP2471" /LENGTH=362 /DNA_ID=CAMNT_0007505155 /DNA_START=236 /DNA_END=1320 /DNA_ORIENTATION=-
MSLSWFARTFGGGSGGRSTAGDGGSSSTGGSSSSSGSSSVAQGSAGGGSSPAGAQASTGGSSSSSAQGPTAGGGGSSFGAQDAKTCFDTAMGRQSITPDDPSSDFAKMAQRAASVWSVVLEKVGSGRFLSFNPQKRGTVVEVTPTANERGAQRYDVHDCLEGSEAGRAFIRGLIVRATENSSNPVTLEEQDDGEGGEPYINYADHPVCIFPLPTYDFDLSYCSAHENSASSTFWAVSFRASCGVVFLMSFHNVQLLFDCTVPDGMIDMQVRGGLRAWYLSEGTDLLSADGLGGDDGTGIGIPSQAHPYTTITWRRSGQEGGRSGKSKRGRTKLLRGVGGRTKKELSRTKNGRRILAGKPPRP